MLAIILYAASLPLEAHPYVPPADYLGIVDKVCIAKVTSVERDKVTFSVISRVKGALSDKLVLTPAFGFSYPLNSEWFLMHLPGDGYWQGHVGYMISGDCEWLPAEAKHVGDAYYFVSSVFPSDKVQPETLSDGTKAFSLEKVKSFLATESRKK